MPRSYPTSIVALAIVALCAAPTASEARRKIADRPVAFEVENTNRSPVPCQADRLGYTVRGHLVGPRREFRRKGPKAVTAYLYGFEVGEWQWRLRAVPRYDFARRMARLGHVSLTIDMLGYDASGHPDGFAACTGSQIDVTDQIVDRLRAGTYRSGRRNALAFDRVALAGHDISGGMVEAVAYAYGGVDALLVLTWVDGLPLVSFSPYLGSRYLEANGRCVTAPERAEGDQGPGGYHFFASHREEEYRANVLWGLEPAVAGAAIELANRNPCGYLASIPPMILANQIHLGEIDEPVLAIMGAEDRVFTPGALALQAPRYSGSDDVTAIELDGAGHFPMLGTAANAYAKLISGWLTERGF